MNNLILKGTICYSVSPTELVVRENAYAVCVNGVSQGVFEEIPAEFAQLPVLDYGDRLIVPGLVDLHIHAPQYTFRGTGMDLELMDWLQQQENLATFTAKKVKKCRKLAVYQVDYSVGSMI